MCVYNRHECGSSEELHHQPGRVEKSHHHGVGQVLEVSLYSFSIQHNCMCMYVCMYDEFRQLLSENKKVLEDRSARYMGVSLTGSVELTLLNVDSSNVTAHSVQVHPQKPEMGRRVMRRFHKVLIDQVDAVTFQVTDEMLCTRYSIEVSNGISCRWVRK